MGQCCALVQREPAATCASLGNVASRSTEFTIPFHSGMRAVEAVSGILGPAMGSLVARRKGHLKQV